MGPLSRDEHVWKREFLRHKTSATGCTGKNKIDYAMATLGPNHSELRYYAPYVAPNMPADILSRVAPEGSSFTD